MAIRLDGPDGAAPNVDLEDLASAIRVGHSQTDVADGDGRRIGWGHQLDVKIIGAHIGRERLAGYFAKYATKSSDAKGLLGSRIRNEAQLACLPVNDHLARLVRTSWSLANRYPESGLDRWAHQFGFRGHFLTKSRSWSTTFKALRQRRADYHAEAQRQAWEALAPTAQLVIESHWEFAGTGYRSAAEAELAALRRAAQNQARAAA